MTFDISLGETSNASAPAEQTFEEFYATHAAIIGKALALACGDTELTGKALSVSLARSSQRCKYLVGHANPVGWTLQTGLVEASKELREQLSTAMNEATGGYIRGIGLVDALAALPLNQRGGGVACCAVHRSSRR